MNAVLGTDARRRGRVGRARAARHRARRAPTSTGDGDTVVAIVPDVPPRPRARDRPGRGGGAPHRLRPHRPHAARHATARSAGSRVRQQERRARRRRARRASACSEAITLSLVSPADLERAGAPARPRRARHRTRCAPRSRCCARGPRPGCCARSPATARTASPTSRCSSMGRVFLTRRPPAAGPLPDEPEHVAVALAGHGAPPPGRGRPPGRRVRRGRRGPRRRRRARRSTTFALEPARRRRLPRRVAPRGCSSAASTSGAVGEVAPTRCSTRSGSTRPVVAAELVLDTLLAAPRRDRTFRAPSRFPASTIDLAFVVADAVAAADVVAARCAPRSATLLEDVRPFDVFRSDALGAGRRSLAFALRFRAPDRTLTDAEVGELRQRAIDAVVARPRRRAPRLSSVRSSTTSGRATRRSTCRAWCSTPTGSRTSTSRQTRFFECARARARRSRSSATST